MPIEIETVEEVPLGTRIGHVTAVDNDQGENAIIEYAIIGEYAEEYEIAGPLPISFF